nr:Chain B, Major prion protein [Homo sapiens]4E1H_D Chain D, Major prion protein [Homo sapiens]4E1H_F Chain F, Major prion protein [Homo sapiens]4E1H_H Chain H, Major prion protein [Homo sapiens]4E1H_J Chain J, Major prion protein [Homo sapiens]4E1H_L Chain L, Major prion protein [Homo sapiens]4E1I_B Chain B, Major prion protein [Homo sapiens]4E1I_D Chain D, Major prion protein [Homo sapiens]4E1I_F Chain F, Major prion protein [Homo sapiens]4E1I_H Chain H, Major prion protein [Homo sapien
EQMCIT